MSLFVGIRPGGLFGEGGGQGTAPLPDGAGMAAPPVAPMPAAAPGIPPRAAPPTLSGSDLAQRLARVQAFVDGNGDAAVTAAMRDARERFAQRQIGALIDSDPGLASPEAKAFARRFPGDYLSAALARGGAGDVAPGYPSTAVPAVSRPGDGLVPLANPVVASIVPGRNTGALGAGA